MYSTSLIIENYECLLQAQVFHDISGEVASVHATPFYYQRTGSDWASVHKVKIPADILGAFEAWAKTIVQER